MATATQYIHVNQHVDARNRREGTSDPCLTVKQGRTNRYAAEVEILGPDGAAVARVCYRPAEPLPTGARCWVETYAPLRLLRRQGGPFELPAGKTVVHVSKQAIRRNQKAGGEPVPVLTAERNDLHTGHIEIDGVEVLGPAGEVLASITYRPHKPLPCGARCWVETRAEVRLIGETTAAALATKGATP